MNRKRHAAFFLSLVLSCMAIGTCRVQPREVGSENQQQVSQSASPPSADAQRNGNLPYGGSITVPAVNSTDGYITLPASLSSATSGAGAALSPNSLPILSPTQPNTIVAGLTWFPIPSGISELFMAGGPSQNEILQGGDNDCILFSLLGAMVASSPNSIVDIIALVGKTVDGTDVYAVTLFDAIAQRPVTINVDASFLLKQNAASANMPYDVFYTDSTTNKLVLWPLLVQKALAVYFGGYESLGNPMASLMPILTSRFSLAVMGPQGGIEDIGSPSFLLTKYTRMNAPLTCDSHIIMKNKANDGSLTPITSQAPYNCASVQNALFCLVDNHEYEIISFDGNILTLRNPWGTNIGAAVGPNGMVSLPLDAFTALTSTTWTPGAFIVPR